MFAFGDDTVAVEGRVSVLGTLRLDTRFEGSIACTRLIVGSNGYIIGEVSADEIEIEGQIIGRVVARRCRS